MEVKWWEKQVGMSDWARTITGPSVIGSAAVAAQNAAYAKLISNLGDSPQLAVNYAERHQALGAIATRAKQIAAVVVALRRGDVSRACRLLGIQRPKGLRSSLRDWAGIFLELHFGWVPLVQDIGNAIEVLQGPIKNLRITGVGHAKSDLGMSTYGQTWEKGYHWTSAVEELRCFMIADFIVDNPNLRLASQMGFINPLTVAWELVPFSFVLDWFANVGACLASFTDFTGLQLLEPATTFTGTRTRTDAYPNYGWVSIGTGFLMQRSRGISTPILNVRPFKGFSPVRGVTAISLLLQTLKGN